MLKYKIKAIRYGANEVLYIPVFEDKSIQILTNFLSDDYFLLSDEINNAVIPFEMAGNAYAIEVDEQNCHIIPTIDGDENVECTIKTEDFKALIREWDKDMETLKKTIVE